MRRLTHALLTLLLGVVPLALGVGMALMYTPAGRGLLARNLTGFLAGVVRGKVEVREISGSFLFSLTLRDLTVRDTTGELFVQAPELQVHYRLPNLLAGRIVFTDVRMERPTLQFIKHRNGRMNYEEILRLNESAGGGGPSPLVEFRDVQVDSGTVRVFTPWNPSDSGRLAAELAAQREKPGRIIEDGPEGLRKLIRAEYVSGRFPRLRLASPDGGPVVVQVDTLRAALNDPGMDIHDYNGLVEAKGDSVRLQISRGGFANTRFSGDGYLTFPRDTLLLDLTLDIPTLDLRDLRWISPLFPSMTGSVKVRAQSVSGALTDYRLTDLRLSGGPGSLEGDMIAVTDVHRGLGVRNLDLQTRGLDLETVRPYLDTLPLVGTITGRLQAGGFFDSMVVALDADYTEARLPERPVSHLTGHGDLTLTGPDGTVFHNFQLDNSDLDLATVRLMASAVVLEGRARLSGTLDGPWKDVTFRGRMAHQDGDRPVSVVTGMVRLDTRGDTLGLATDVVLEPLDFDGIRRGFPSLRSRGSLNGSVRSSGTLADLDLDADVHGDLGTVQARGRITLLPPRYGADSLTLRFTGLDLEQVTGSGPETWLTGSAQVSGVSDTLQAPAGSMVVALDTGQVREFSLDSLYAELLIQDSVLRLDTLELDWGGVRAGGRLSGGGSLGWARPHAGQLRLFAVAASLAPFDSLLMVLSGAARDTAVDAVPLDGAGTIQLALGGSLDSLVATGSVNLEGFAWQRYRAPFAGGTFEWHGGARPRLAITFQSDSVRAGDLAYRAVDISLAGRTDSLSWSGSAEAVPRALLSSAGRWWKRDGGWTLALDSLSAGLAVHRWRLAAPSRIEADSLAVRFDGVRLVTGDGAGSIRLNGALPRAGEGHLVMEVRGGDLKDVYALLQRDTSSVAGSITLDVEVNGTAANPVMSGSGTLGDAVFGDFRSPFVQGVFDYRDRLLDANLLLFRTGVQVLQLEAQLPLDLALQPVAERQVPGNLLLRAKADSVNLALLEAFTPNLRRVQGLMKADVEIRGTWDAPQLAGTLDLLNGAATVPALGVRYGYLTGHLRFDGDSIVIERLRTTSGPGDLVLTGGIQLEKLTRPVLNVRLQARDFRAIDDPTYLTLEVSGTGTLTGPVYGATLKGDITARAGVLHFADLVNKRIIDLSDPVARELIDTSLIRTENLGPAFQSVFLDSLTIEDLRLTVQDQFWLRSSDANVQLEGAVTVNKRGPEYRFDGTFNALRGVYTLRVGFVTRDFQVDRGTVRYFGTPDLNAELDIQATHVVQASGEEIPVIAQITGTLQLPKLSLTSTIRPQPTESELVSYLMFGRPSPDIPILGGAENSQRQAAFDAALSYLTSAFSSEVQRTLISDLGLPIDFIEFRTGISNPFSGGGGRTELAAGVQLTNRTFVTVNAGFCRAELATIGVQSLGAGLEYRLNRQWKFQTSLDPVLSCQPNGEAAQNLSNSTRYQFGVDALWDKDY